MSSSLGSSENHTELREDIRDPDFFRDLQGLSPQNHSMVIDKYLGFKIPKIEQFLLKRYRAFFKPSGKSRKKRHYDESQTWIGLHPQVLQTPYTEILKFLEFFKNYPVKKVIDLGAGYGRVGVVMNSLFPNAEFLGYELLDDRIKEAKRMFEILGLDNCEMKCQNIVDYNFVIPQADIYFLYDFSNPVDLKVVLNKLEEKLTCERFFIIAKGDGIRSLIQNKYPCFWASFGAIHQKGWSIYSSFSKLQ